MKRLKGGTECFLGLGANLPYGGLEPSETLNSAVDALTVSGLKDVVVSGFYLTKPVPFTDQPDFVNCVLRASTVLDPGDLLSVCQSVESKFGRVRDTRWHARTLDIDVLSHGDTILPGKAGWHNLMEAGRDGTIFTDLVLPHPRLHERAFVLKPLNDICPHWQHPVMGKTAEELMSALGADELKGVRPFFANSQ